MKCQALVNRYLKLDNLCHSSKTFVGYGSIAKCYSLQNILGYNRVSTVTVNALGFLKVCVRRGKGGGVLIAYIVQSFQKLFVPLDPIPSPYKESPAQMNSGRAGNSLYRFILV